MVLMKTEMFYKLLAFWYSIISVAIIIAVYATGLFWEIIDILLGDLKTYSNFYGNYNEIVDITYFVVAFLNVVVKASFIFYKGLCLERGAKNTQCGE